MRLGNLCPCETNPAGCADEVEMLPFGLNRSDSLLSDCRTRREFREATHGSPDVREIYRSS